MIQRIVLLDIEETEIEKVIEESKKVLPAIPLVKSLQIGEVEDNPDYNLALIILFDNLQDIKAFRPHPQHRDYVDNFLKEKLKNIKAYNIKIL